MIRVGLGISSEYSTKAAASTRIDWIARPGVTGTSGTQFTTEPGMMSGDGMVQMKDFDLSRMKGHDEIEVAEVELPTTSYSEHEGVSPV